ncbi:MAG: hypothetical protein U0175_20570 [Caldilineaceae bacterium]
MFFNHLQIHHFPFDRTQIPHDGIYILFEVGETAHGTNRIVRVGTHTGSGQLRSRLEQHFVHENKDRSIFRKNIGRAILSRNHDPFLAQWEIDLTTTTAKQRHGASVDTGKQKQIEQQVSQYIRNHFFFAVYCIEDKDERMELESKLISTVSLCTDCCPTDSWLGQYSPKERIRESGLWLVNELYKQTLSSSEYDYFFVKQSLR